MFIAFILPHEVETAGIIVETHERFHRKYEVCEVEGMLDLVTVGPLYFDTIHKMLNVLLEAEIHDGQVLKADEGILICLRWGSHCYKTHGLLSL
jgi:hypothetical protein